MKILLVEGNQDKAFVEALMGRRKIYPKESYGDFEFQVASGYEKILNILPTLIIAENHETIGIIIDSDTERLAHWNQVLDILKESGYLSLPKEPDKKGTIITQEEEELPKIGVWIMPDNQTDGKLETFVKYLIPKPENDALLRLAQETVNTLIENQIHKFSESDKEKAILHTWLAWQKEPGLSLAQAVTLRFKNQFVLDDKKANDFITWLQKLFK